MKRMAAAALVLAVALAVACTATAHEYHITNEDGVLFLDDDASGLVMSINHDGSGKAMFLSNGKLGNVGGFRYFILELAPGGLVDIWGTPGGSQWTYLGRF